MDPLLPYNLDECKRDIYNIAAQMSAASWKPSLIVGLSRGGAVPAVMLSHAIGGVSIVSEAPRDVPSTIEYGSANILIIDDICDSGRTFRKLQQYYANLKTAALIYNTESGVSVDFYGQRIQRSKQPLWYQFFWELPVPPTSYSL